MLAKQNKSNDFKANEQCSLEPEVQIKEEVDFVDVSYEEDASKRKIKDPSLVINNEIFEDFNVKLEKEESLLPKKEEKIENEENGGSELSALVEKINQDTVEMRGPSVLNVGPRRKLPDWSDINCEKTLFTCNKCVINFESESDLLEHEENHKNSFFHCIKCDQVFDRAFALKIHQASHDALRQHKCDICDKSFTRKSGLNDHALSHSGEKPYQCTVCKKYYRSKLSLASHSRYHYKAKEHKCPVCKKLFFQPSGLTEHLRMHQNTKGYLCNICKKHYSYKSTLKRHIRSHYTTDKHVCDECDKCFKQNSSLLYHKRTKHLGLKPYKCEDCEKTFTRSRSLKLHMNSHRALQIQNTIKIINER